jgi:thiol-disulfide isomerase/thioredoxin
MSSHDSVLPGRRTRRPRHDNDIKIGDYYYGIHCPHCKDMSPMIESVNQNLIGARIDTTATDEVYDVHVTKHESISSKLSAGVRSTFKNKIIEVTPTVIWKDGLVTEGVPYKDGHEVNELELREYMCVRAAKCYLKETNPGMHSEEIQGMIDQVFGGRFVQRRTKEGVVRRPFEGLREITHRY